MFKTFAEALFLFVLAHLLSDYVWQGEYIATTKAKNTYHLLVHVAIATGVFYLAMRLMGNVRWLLVGITFVSHLAIDKWKCVKGHSGKTYVIDQLLHYIVVIGCALAYAY